MTFFGNNTVKRFFIAAIIALVFGLVPGFAENLAIASARDEGSSDPVHPAQYLIDGKNDTAFKAATNASHAWVVVSLSQTRRILGLSFTGSGSGTEKYTVEYESSGRWVPFLSALGQSFSWQNGTARADLSSDSVDTSKLRISFDAAHLSSLSLSELSISGEDLASVSQIITPASLRASSNTSNYSDEWELFDDNPASYWLVEQNANWNLIDWFVDDYAKIRHQPRLRDTPNWLEGSVEATLPANTRVDELKLYATSKVSGQYSVEYYGVNGWKTLLSLRAVPTSPGWIIIPVNDMASKVRIKVQRQPQDKTMAGFGELEIWGVTGTSSAPTRTYIAPPVSSTNGFKDASFVWNPSISGSADIDVAFDAQSVNSPQTVPSIELNGISYQAVKSKVVGDLRIATYHPDSGVWWTGDNFIRVVQPASGPAISARGALVYAKAHTGVTDDLPVTGWTDGLNLTATQSPADGIVLLGGIKNLSRIDVFASASTVSGVSAWVKGSWVSLPKSYTMSDELRTVFSGNKLFAEKLRVEGNTTLVTEVRVWASDAEPVPLTIDTVYPSVDQTMPVENHGFQSLYGEVSDPNAVVKVNGKTAKQYGQLFWIALKDLDPNPAGIVSATVVATTTDGRTAQQTRTWFIENSGYEITVQDLNTTVYTNLSTYTVKGTFNPYASTVFVNGTAVQSSGNNFSSVVNLQAGLNLIKVEQKDKNSLKTAHVFYVKVWRQTSNLALKITSHTGPVYTNAATITLSGEVSGTGAVTVTAGGKTATVSGQYWTSQVLNLNNGANTIVVTATDATGAQTSQSISVTRDSTAPVVTVTKPTVAQELGSSTVRIEGTVTDNSPVTVFVNGTSAVVNGSTYSADLDFADGARSVSVYAVDRAGNNGASVTRNFIVDTTPPLAFNPNISPVSWTFAATHTVTFATTDTTTSVAYYEGSVDNGAFVHVTSPWSVAIPGDGEHVVSVRAVDRTGNVRAGSPVSAFVDRTAPAAVNGLRGVSGDGTQLVRFGITEPEFVSLEISRTPAWSNGTRTIAKNSGVVDQPESDPGTYRYEYTDNDVTVGSTYSYSVRAVDRAGNKSLVNTSDPVMNGASVSAYTSDSGSLVEYVGAMVNIAPGSLPQSVKEIVISKIDSPDMARTADVPLASPIFRFVAKVQTGNTDVPADTVDFSEPFVGSIAYNPAKLNGFPVSSLSAYYFDTTWSVWVRVPDSYVDAGNNQVYFKTNHFTPFAVKPTTAAELSAEDMAKVPFGIASPTAIHEPLNVSAQSGSASTAMTELQVPGRNGYPFALKRSYDSGTAQTDGTKSSPTFVPRYPFPEEWDTSTYSNGSSSGSNTSTTIIPSGQLISADQGLSMGKGWRLNLPYLATKDGQITVRTPDGSMFDVGDLNLSVDNTSSTNRTLTFTPYKDGEDITLIVRQVIANVQITTGVDDKGNDILSETSWTLDSATLYLHDGSHSDIDNKGRVTAMYDPDGKKYLSVSYDPTNVYNITSITHIVSDQLHRRFTFVYDSAHTYITEIHAPANIGERVIYYTQDTDGTLKTATDAGGRVFSYTYEAQRVSSGTLIHLPEVTHQYTVPVLDNSTQGWHYEVRTQTIVPEKELIQATSTEFGAIKTLAGPGLGRQELVYDKKELSWTGFTAGHYSASAQKLVYAKSLEVGRTDTDTDSRTTTYEYNFDHYPAYDQVMNLKSTVSDPRVKNVYTYSVGTAKRSDVVSYSDPTKEPSTAREVNVYLPQLTQQETYDLTRLGLLIQTEKFVYAADTLRMMIHRTIRSESVWALSEYKYDRFGNVIQSKRLENTGTATTNQLTYSFYAGAWSNPAGENTVTTALQDSGLSSDDRQAIQTDLSASVLSRHDAQIISIQKNEVPIIGNMPPNGGTQWLVTRTTYSAASFGQPASVSERVNDAWHKTKFDYDPVSSELTKSTSPLGFVTNVARDYAASSNTPGTYTTTTSIDVTDPDGASHTIQTSATYAAATGDALSQTSGENHVTSYTYDNIDRIKSITKPALLNGQQPVTSVIYHDGIDNMSVDVSKPDGHGDTYLFDQLGRVTSIQRINRPYNTLTAERLSEVSDPITSTLSYDMFGQISTYSDPRQKVTTFAYDGMGQLIKTTLPGSPAPKSTVAMDWQNSIRTSVDTEGLNIVENLRFDGKPTQRAITGLSEPLTESMTYDSLGHMIGLVDRKTNVTLTQFNERGQPVRQISPKASFNINGITVQGYLAQDTSYDDDGRAVSTSAKLLDDNGAVISSAVIAGVTYELDALGRTIKTKQSYTNHTLTNIAGSTANIESWVFYDDDGNPVKTVDPNNTPTTVGGAIGDNVRIEYNERGLKSKIIDQDQKETLFEYDDNDNLTRMLDPRQTNPNGNEYTIRYSYDDLNRLIRAIQPPVLGSTTAPITQFSYTKSGNLESRIEPNEKKTSYIYNDRNWVASETVTADAESFVTSYTYNTKGNVKTITAPGSLVTTSTYDRLGRTLSVLYPAGNSVAYTYDPLNNVTSVMDGRGKITTNTYDVLNRMTSTTDPIETETTYLYDVTGKPNSITVTPVDTTLQQTRTFQFDDRGQLIKETNSRGKVYRYEYDNAGRLRKTKDPNGTTTSATYTRTGQTESNNLVNGANTFNRSYTYDVAGQLETATDGLVTSTYNVFSLNNQPAQYHSDPYGLIFSQTESGRTTSYRYDDFLRLTGITSGHGEHVGYSYDRLNRLTEITGFTTGISYDATTGRLNSITGANSVTNEFSYDKNDRLTGLKYSKGTQVLLNDTFAYDGNNNVTAKNNNLYSYNAINELTAANLDARFAADITKSQTPMKVDRDVRGQKQLAYLNVDTEISLDTDARSIAVDFGDRKEIYGFLITPRSVSRLTPHNLRVYLSDVNADRNFTEYRDYEVKINTDGSILISFRTPQWARFAKVQSSWDDRSFTNTAIDTSTAHNLAKVLVKAYYFDRYKNESYSYDGLGRRTDYAGTYPQNGRDNESETYAYYPHSELLKTNGKNFYKYDSNGNQIAKGPHGTDAAEVDTTPTVTITNEDGAWKYNYDLLNRLISVQKFNAGTNGYVTVASYVYNHKNERIQKIDKNGLVTRWTYDLSGQVQTVEYPDGVTETLVWMGSVIFAHVLKDANGTTKTEYFGTDNLGSTVFVTDAQGNIRSQNDTNPFGIPTGSSGFDDLTVRYTGKDLDEDTGLYYYNARWYDPETGRFITEDPIKDGDLWYGYVGNNPMTLTDPTGLAPYSNGYYDGPYDPNYTPTYGPENKPNTTVSEAQRAEAERKRAAEIAKLRIVYADGPQADNLKLGEAVNANDDIVLTEGDLVLAEFLGYSIVLNKPGRYNSGALQAMIFADVFSKQNESDLEKAFHIAGQKMLGMAKLPMFGFASGVLNYLGNSLAGNYNQYLDNGDIGAMMPDIVAASVNVAALKIPDLGPTGSGIVAGNGAALAEEGTTTLYRGVPSTHEGYADALLGNANPLGGHDNVVLHSFGDTRSVFTSWSLDPAIATEKAIRWNGTGVLLAKTVPNSHMIIPPAHVQEIMEEMEVLLKGPVTGATVTNVP